MKKYLPFLFLTALVICANGQNASKKQPNIVVILSDDAGYADFSYTGTKRIQTPNIDSIASNGVTLTAGYVSGSVCSPSRAGFLTGRYQQRFGHEYNLGGYVIGDDREVAGMAIEEKTIADYLKKVGYTTACFGKWHLGYADKFHPNQRGFDYFYGFRSGSHSYFNTAGVEEQMKKVPLRKDIYMTELLTEKACDYIRRQKAEKPFFVFMSYNAPHTPLHAKKEDMDALKHIKSKKRRATLAMTVSLDREVGRILKTLKEKGIHDNTMIVFFNDNGGQVQTNHANNAPYRGMKGTFYDGGIRVPFAIQWPGKIKPKTILKDPIISLDLLPTFLAAAGVDSKNVIDKKRPTDGVNLLPYIRGEKTGRPHQTLYWRRARASALRDGDYKLIRLIDRPAMLYDLKADPSEQTNIAASNPEKVQMLLTKLYTWEMSLTHPRWRTGYNWIRDNTKKYDLDYNIIAD